MSSSTDDLLPVGHVRRAHGLRGDVVVHSDSDNPERFATGATLFLEGDPSRQVVVAASSPVTDGLLVHFVTVDDRESAEALRGCTLTISRRQRRDLDVDEFWPDDLIGATVVDVAGTTLGTVSGIEYGPAQDRLVVTTGAGRAVEVPFVAAIVTEVSPDASTIIVDPPDGLFPA